MNEKTITITKEQFAEAVSEASDKFMAIGQDANDRNPMTLAIMGMQNMMFGSLIARVLFGEEENESEGK